MLISVWCKDGRIICHVFAIASGRVEEDERGILFVILTAIISMLFGLVGIISSIVIVADESGKASKTMSVIGLGFLVFGALTIPPPALGESPGDQGVDPPVSISDALERTTDPAGSENDSSTLKGRIIAVDPGHGGPDPGAIGPGGTLEKDITLSISNYLIVFLEEAGAQVVATRREDRDVARGERQGVANRAGADALISIHVNAHDLDAVVGTETYYHSNHPRSEHLAQEVQDRLVEGLGSRDRGIRHESFSILRGAHMPAVLVECLYLSSPLEEERLLDPGVRRTIARAILRALEAFFDEPQTQG